MRRYLTLHDPALARDYHDRGWWTDASFYKLGRSHAARHPDRFAARDSGRRLTWSELMAFSDAVAARFEDAGLERGDLISMCVSNRIEALGVLLACSRNGYVCHPSIHKTMSRPEIVEVLKKFRPSILIREAGFGEAGTLTVEEAAATGIASLREIITLQSGRSVPVSLASAFADAPAASEPSGDPDSPLIFLLTSGTTGQPKGIMHSDNTYLANARDLVADWCQDEHTTLCALSPASHGMFWVGFAQTIVAGGEFVANDPPPNHSLIDWINLSEANYVMGVPTNVVDILAEQKRKPVEFAKLKTFYIAGSAIPRSAAEGLLAQGIKPMNVYGMSENLSCQYTRPDDDLETLVSTVGRPGPSFLTAIFDTDDVNRVLNSGEVGQIGGRGASLMLGYYADQLETEQSFNRDGWFMSGDLGYIDDAGCLTFAGRIKDVIIRGGKNIYPIAIEDAAVRHPRIDSAAAFGLPDERLGERICLAVDCEDGAEPDCEDVLAHLKSMGLAKYQMPEFILFVNEMPLNSTGKIMKSIILDRIAKSELVPTRIDKVAT